MPIKSLIFIIFFIFEKQNLYYLDTLFQRRRMNLGEEGEELFHYHTSIEVFIYQYIIL